VHPPSGVLERTVRFARERRLAGNGLRAGREAADDRAHRGRVIRSLDEGEQQERPGSGAVGGDGEWPDRTSDAAVGAQSEDLVLRVRCEVGQIHRHVADVGRRGRAI